MSRSLVVVLACSLLSAGLASARPCPNIMLVLDQSGSMAQDPNGLLPADPMFTQSKFSLLQQAVTQLVTSYGGHVPFGLELFSLDGFSRNDDGCYSGTSITIPISHDSSRQIIDTVNATSALDGHSTNTAAAIKRAASFVADKVANPGQTDLHDPTPGKQNIILLVTDGDPDCGSDGKSAALSDPPGIIGFDYGNTTLNEEDDALKQKIKTYVLAFDGSGGVNPVNLENMGYYGGNKIPGCGVAGPHCYFKAGMSLMDFVAVIDSIVNSQCGGEFCDQCDDTCVGSGCPNGQICTSTETNPSPHCENNACSGMTCPDNTFCRAGTCVKACSKGCAASEICVDGICSKDLCSGVKCTSPQVCKPSTGQCIPYPCPDCLPKTICDYESGKCLADPCLTINCAKGQTCVSTGGGNCTAGPGGGGCSTVGQPQEAAFDGKVALAAAALLLSLGMMLRRFRRAR